MKTDKRSLRQFFKGQRALLSQQEILDRSAQLGDRLLSAFPWKGVEWVHCFMPIPDKKEVHTPIILHKLKVYHPNLTFVLPRVEGQSLVSHLWEPSHTLLASSFGVPEPPPLPETVVHPAMLDVIVVPLLAHDQGGHRVGYGAGYYDRFLALCRPDAITVGLSFFPPVEVITDLHPNDVPLKLCIVA